MALVFVYGTLTDRETAASVLPAFEYRGAATLDGLQRVDGEYPTLAPGGEVSGRLLETAHLDALDRYEGVDSGLYLRVSVPLIGGTADDGVETIETYVGDPVRLGVDVDWPGSGAFETRVRTSLREHDVRVEREC
jgi:gamma-glutamylcyclotransferase (GGCT)/AIG2-like uncharacterized protein YtfP